MSRGIVRRSALALGMAAAAAPVLARSKAAAAYGAEEGEEIFPGVRMVELSSRKSLLPGYDRLDMVDIIFDPSSEFPETPMDNDMVCLITEGELQVVQDGEAFRAATGDVYSCATGTVEGARNETDTAAIMRVIQLMSG